MRSCWREKPEPKGRGRGRGSPVTTPLLCTHVSDRSNEEAPEHVQAGPARVNGASWLRLFPLLFACLVLGGFVPAVMAPIYFLTHGDFSSSSGCAFPSVSQKQNARDIKTLDESFAKKKHWMKKNPRVVNKTPSRESITNYKPNLLLRLLFYTTSPDPCSHTKMSSCTFAVERDTDNTLPEESCRKRVIQTTR